MTDTEIIDKLYQAPKTISAGQRKKISEFFAEGCWTCQDGTAYKVGNEEKYLESEWTAHRFLIARNYDVEKARTMFSAHLSVRKDMDLANILEKFQIKPEEEEAVSKYCPQYWLGVDNEGRPIYVQVFTFLDGKKLFENITAERILECQAFTCEYLIKKVLPECSKAFGKPIRQTASMIDFKDVSYGQLWTARWFAKKYLSFQSANYPDYLGRSYVINAPSSLTVVWEMAKRILPRATVEKVQILGSNYQSQIQRSIPLESLAEDYGGTRTDIHNGIPQMSAILGQKYKEPSPEKTKQNDQSDNSASKTAETPDAKPAITEEKPSEKVEKGKQKPLQPVSNPSKENASVTITTQDRIPSLITT